MTQGIQKNLGLFSSGEAMLERNLTSLTPR